MRTGSTVVLVGPRPSRSVQVKSVSGPKIIYVTYKTTKRRNDETGVGARMFGSWCLGVWVFGCLGVFACSFEEDELTSAVGVLSTTCYLLGIWRPAPTSEACGLRLRRGAPLGYSCYSESPPQMASADAFMTLKPNSRFQIHDSNVR